MSSSVILVLSLLLTFAILIVGAMLGRNHNNDLEGWLVHHRGMGSVLLWFLLGSEIYTAFTFQGLAGYSYTKGAAGFYNVAQNDVSYAVAFLVLPCIWALGKRYGHVTQADFIAHRYRSRGLGIFTAFASALIMIAYIDLNIEGLAAIFHVLGGNVSPVVGNLIGFAVLAIAVFIGGIRGNAMQSVAKDLLMFLAIAAIFIAVPVHYFGGFGKMFNAFNTRTPQYFELGKVAKDLGPTWLWSTVLLTGLGQWMWPQWFGAAFTAKSPRSLKRQAVFMPFYQLVKVAVLIVGFAAVMALGSGHPGNNVVMTMAKEIFPGWALVLIVVAAMLAAIVPGGPIVMTSASLLAKNVVQQLRPQTADRTIFWLTRALVFPLTFTALIITLWAPALIVNVLLLAYAFIAQLFPAVVVGGIFWRRATKQGVLTGLLTGWAVTGYLQLAGHDTLWGINTGLIGLAANLLAFAAVSLVTPAVEGTESVRETLDLVAVEEEATAGERRKKVTTTPRTAAEGA
ncbi:sodium:solute symporter [Actinoallomurus oryzae]|uniref:Sodium:solute symporter n=1 Tax=Actinoallomurus oryzae TaxID=502180 RepID=A0ABP8QDT0_9ACTN